MRTRLVGVVVEARYPTHAPHRSNDTPGAVVIALYQGNSRLHVEVPVTLKQDETPPDVGTRLAVTIEREA